MYRNRTGINFHLFGFTPRRNERALMNLIEDGNKNSGITKEELIPYIDFFKADKSRINKLEMCIRDR